MVQIKRYYLDEFNETKHESTAVLPIIDLCETHARQMNVENYETEENTPSDISCEFLGCKN